MNLDKLFAWILTVVIGVAATGNLGVLQRWIWQAQAKVIYESRSSQWGSPKFFPDATSGAREKSKPSKLK